MNLGYETHLHVLHHFPLLPGMFTLVGGRYLIFWGPSHSFMSTVLVEIISMYGRLDFRKNGGLA